ncbi:MAG TPA: 2Fe-2S iron-sulfur cluster binding domain-containing protein [Amycolatopsis sp.]
MELAKAGSVLPVPGDRSILKVVEGAGVTVLSSCREGTCATGVRPGTPGHRDSVLIAEEQEGGDATVIRASRSCSPRPVLDL